MADSYNFGGFTTTVEYSNGGKTLSELSGADLTVFDENTTQLFPAFRDKKIILTPGESAKTLESVRLILDESIRGNLSRSSTIAGVGGGVICDLAAFAASIYMRGTGLTLVPTTLLAMVDASLGGKTGMNYAGYKNMVGTFYPAGRLIILPETLKSLPDREFRSGLAEVIKTAALGDEELLGILETRKNEILKRDQDLLLDVVRRCIMVKGRFVEQDLREKNVRAYLNLGHTFAHALESVTNFISYTHGEAVAWGISRALDLGKTLGITDAGYSRRLSSLLASYGFDLRLRLHSVDSLLAAMRQDKKKNNHGIMFVLQKDLCETLVRHVPEETVRTILEN